jgi:hypothetical protein
MVRSPCDPGPFSATENRLAFGRLGAAIGLHKVLIPLNPSAFEHSRLALPPAARRNPYRPFPRRSVRRTAVLPPLPPYRSEGTSLASIRRRVATIMADFQRERSGRRIRSCDLTGPLRQCPIPAYEHGTGRVFHKRRRSMTQYGQEPSAVVTGISLLPVRAASYWEGLSPFLGCPFPG